MPSQQRERLPVIGRAPGSKGSVIGPPSPGNDKPAIGKRSRNGGCPQAQHTGGVSKPSTVQVPEVSTRAWSGQRPQLSAKLMKVPAHSMGQGPGAPNHRTDPPNGQGSGQNI